MPPQLQRPKGTQDILPVTETAGNSRIWAKLEADFRTFLARAGYQEIRTPIFEATDLFARGVGESTDIVNKEMYSFEKGDRSLTLRPEGTAGVVRAYLENGMARWPKPVKLFYTGPMFRYERPQAGRQRQFHQAGLELLGLDTSAADAEVLLLAMRWFEQLGLTGLHLELNNLGTAQCRERFREILRAALAPLLDRLCDTCQTRYHTNPLRILDCKVPGCQQVLKELPAEVLEGEYANEDSQAHFNAVCDTLSALEVPWTRNRSLVRGLDYYTGLVFEVTANDLGAQNTVCGGGRYNGLAELLGGPATPAVGWAFGMERLIALLPQTPKPASLDCYICADPDTQNRAFAVAERLRAQGFSAEVDLSGKSLQKKRNDQLALATKRGARYAIFWTDEESLGAQGEVFLKNMTSGEQTQVTAKDLLNTLKMA